MWRNITMESGDIHTVPDDDWHEHELTISCWCEPRVDGFRGKDNIARMYYCHNSADGREAVEWAEDILESASFNN